MGWGETVPVIQYLVDKTVFYDGDIARRVKTRYNSGSYLPSY